MESKESKITLNGVRMKEIHLIEVGTKFDALEDRRPPMVDRRSDGGTVVRGPGPHEPVREPG